MEEGDTLSVHSTYNVHSSLKLVQRRAKDEQDQAISTSIEWRKKGFNGRESYLLSPASALMLTLYTHCLSSGVALHTHTNVLL